MPVLAEAFLSPTSRQKSVATQLPQRKGCLYRAGDAVFLGFTHCKTHPSCFSHLYSFPSPILFRTPLTILRPSKTHSSRHAAAAYHNRILSRVPHAPARLTEALYILAPCLKSSALSVVILPANKAAEPVYCFIAQIEAGVAG